ncbi:DNA/RNA helicase domain-containing protein [Marinobacter sp. ATCH36]|uniref:DNA/RNA helicase domain-containing protein n=1 Tax=Marinobacter sp. ATCH36 TaxID=2945106 RepID=UPI002020DF5C|nr:DNA/RNA helicase domain-containing protein [Marinobacter sp. ATCH36]MCL7943920.1 DUF2075 domain-containing protein [Marinobacter sp. ATCH36]
MTDPHLVEVNRYPFSNESLVDIQNNAYAGNSWPLVYILSDGGQKRAYVGETTDTLSRLSTHLKHNEKSLLTTVHLISSERFNKSATLDIESGLIKYMAADGKFHLMNGNLGLVDHNYYQKDELYTRVFRAAWDRLRAEGVARHSLESIDNSDVFKYSPYKSLSRDQRQGLLGILYALLDDNVDNLVVEGGAGTGKSVLATFLFKLLNSEYGELNLRSFSEEEDELKSLLENLRERYPKPKMALVVPMTSFRNTLKKAFRSVSGLKADMVISPSELVKNKYDIVLVDESHRLRKRSNLGAYFGSFDKACEALGLDKHACSELDWVCEQSGKAVFFYDENQSIKPSDANPIDFARLKAASTTQVQILSSQFRVRAGQPYVTFIDDLLNVRLPEGKKFRNSNYEFEVFDSIEEMVRVIRDKNDQIGLSRLIAGYAWPWISKGEPAEYDIEIDGLCLRWNRTNSDWINTAGAEAEVGCIHTTQGYDLNYTGIIFGHEIRYDKAINRIVIDKESYFDRNGKQGIHDPYELKQYILNIYETIMLRGIRGTYVYACDASLREYLKRHIPSHTEPDGGIESVSSTVTLQPYVNAVPFYDLEAAAGDFSEIQSQSDEDKEWIAVPDYVSVTRNLFACRVIGESMNRIIPNGSKCLFRTELGGSRNGKIVLVECSDGRDPDTDSRFTVKEYESIKIEDEGGWYHQLIRLNPRSYDKSFEPLELSEDQALSYRVVGELVQVLG